MQTFLPYPDFAKTASVLDMKRLGKQRVEAWQILQAITNLSYGWQHHPAVNMWRGYEISLYRYIDVICREWREWGYIDTIFTKSIDYTNSILPYPAIWMREIKPPWLGKEEVHLSHQSNLLFKGSVDSLVKSFSIYLGHTYKVWRESYDLPKSKSQITHEQRDYLLKIAQRQYIELLPNHYTFDVPDDLPYVWPTE